MHRYVLSFFAAVALTGLLATVVPAEAESSSAAVVPLQMLAGSWLCQTTEADGLDFTEIDEGAPMGSNWLHGTARPDPRASAPPGAKPQPFYDYYLGYAAGRWVYIQVDPSNGTYFVGLNDGNQLVPSKWSVVYPTKRGGYEFTATPRSFTIKYPDLTQVCQNAGAASNAAQPALELNCSTWYAGTGGLAQLGFAEKLTISKPQPGVPWWQGVAHDAAGNVVYAYNIFDVGKQRIAVLINVATGVYTISTSALLKDLNNTVWMVGYPTLQNGFAFTNVNYVNDIPTSLTLVFRDGFQTCTHL